MNAKCSGCNGTGKQYETWAGKRRPITCTVCGGSGEA